MGKNQNLFGYQIRCKGKRESWEENWNPSAMAQGRKHEPIGHGAGEKHGWEKGELRPPSARCCWHISATACSSGVDRDLGNQGRRQLGGCLGGDWRKRSATWRSGAKTALGSIYMGSVYRERKSNTSNGKRLHRNQIRDKKLRTKHLLSVKGKSKSKLNASTINQNTCYFTSAWGAQNRTAVSFS